MSCVGRPRAHGTCPRSCRWDLGQVFCAVCFRHAWLFRGHFCCLASLVTEFQFVEENPDWLTQCLQIDLHARTPQSVLKRFFLFYKVIFNDIKTNKRIRSPKLQWRTKVMRKDRNETVVVGNYYIKICSQALTFTNNHPKIWFWVF